MGASLSNAVETIVYPIKTVGNATFGGKTDKEANITNSNMSEFNSNFVKKEEKLSILIDKLFEDSKSAINTFNSNILFPYCQLLDDHVQILENTDGTGEIRPDREKLIVIIEKIMELYTCDVYHRTPKKIGKFNFIEDEGIIVKNNDDQSFWNISNKIESRMNDISDLHTTIQAFLNKHKNDDIEVFKREINSKCDDDFKKNNNIIQYFWALNEMCYIFIKEIDTHIKFFEQKNKSKLEKLQHYTTGFFSWLGRSGYSYESTAKFYVYFRNNNIRKLLKDKISNKIESFKNAMSVLESIHQTHNLLNHHIIENKTDKFEIEFTQKNENKIFKIKLGNLMIDNYENLCQIITNKINDKIIYEFNNAATLIQCFCRSKSLNMRKITINKLKQEINKKSSNNTKIDSRLFLDKILIPYITFNITHEHPKFENIILIESNTPFTLKEGSSILKIIGWDFKDTECKNRLNDKNEPIGYFLLSKYQLLNDEIQNIIPYSKRHKIMITSLIEFVTKMNIQKSADNNVDAEKV